MREGCLLLLLLLLAGPAARAAAAGAAAAAGGVTFQAHSFNDLREWGAVLRKGATDFKVDPHYVPVAGEEEGAARLLLSHDTPVGTDDDAGAEGYDSVEDLMALLRRPETYALMQEAAGPGTAAERLTVALCYKSAPDFCDETSEAWQQWLAMADAVFEEGVQVQQQVADLYGVTLEFVLDGDGKPKDCLAGRWAPWPSVWIHSDCPADAYWSNDADQGYDRFSVLNEAQNYPRWAGMADENYGKFSHGSEPYRLWEPDDQAIVDKYAALYREHKQHPGGFQFAVNVDPAQIRIYTSPYTGIGSQTPLVDGARNPQLVQLSRTRFVGPSHVVGVSQTLVGLFYELPEEDTCLHYQIYNVHTAERGESIASVTWEPVSGSETLRGDHSQDGSKSDACVQASSAVVATSAAAHHIVRPRRQTSGSVRAPALLVGDTSSGHVFSYKSAIAPRPTQAAPAAAGDASLHLRVQGSSKLPKHATSTIAQREAPHKLTTTATTTRAATAELLAVTATREGAAVSLLRPTHSDSDSCVLELHVQSTAGMAEEESQCVMTPTTSGVFEVEQDIEAPTDAAALRVCTDAAGETDCGVALFAAVASTVYGAFLPEQDDIGDQALQWIPLTVGTHVSVSMTISEVPEFERTKKRDGEKEDDQAVLILVNDDGYCSNSHKHNTQAAPRVCEAQPQSTPRVLEYSVGATADWIALLRGDTPLEQNGMGLSACASTILHGTFSQGSMPSALGLRASAAGKLEVVTAHEGVQTKDLDDGQCGRPVSYDGVQADSFPLPFY